MNRKYLLSAFVLAAGVLYLVSTAPRATATDPAGHDSAAPAQIAVRAWTIDTTTTPPGERAHVSSAGRIRFRPGEQSDDNPPTQRSGLIQDARGENPLERELAVTLVGTDFPYEVRVDFTGFDALRQTWTVSGSLRFAHDGDLKALVGDDPHHVLVVQLSVLKE